MDLSHLNGFNLYLRKDLTQINYIEAVVIGTGKDTMYLW